MPTAWSCGGRVDELAPPGEEDAVDRTDQRVRVFGWQVGPRHVSHRAEQQAQGGAPLLAVDEYHGARAARPVFPGDHDAAKRVWRQRRGGRSHVAPQP